MQLGKPRMWANYDLSYTIDPAARVSVPKSWQLENLVSVKLPIATGILTPVRLHKRAAPVFEAWFRTWDKAACESVKEFGGSFVPRLMRASKNLPKTTNPTKDWNSFLSRHSRGIAIDLNHSYDGNKQGQPGVPPGQPGSLWRVIDLSRSVKVEITDPDGHKWFAGIAPGIDFSGDFVDAMHFEVGEWKA